MSEQQNQLGSEFRRQISRGRSPKIGDFLLRIDDAEKEPLFTHLLDMEVSFRQQRGESPTSAEYVKKFPQYKRAVRRAFFQPSVDPESAGDTDVATLSNSEPKAIDPRFAPTQELDSTARLGDYELVDELGKGGMGIVYEARQIKTGNRVALKTLPTSFDGQPIDANKLHRFRKEFRSLSEVNHPNLVGMQTLEVDEDRWFFTMDLVDGEDFISYVRPQGQLNEERLRHCLPQLAKGIIALHERGIVHRDLKPGNVMVSHQGQILILDFGLVAEIQADAQKTQTASAIFAGTPPYAAPEQLGNHKTEANDWYGFGTMLYEALVGEVPFPQNGADAYQLMQRKQQEDPPKLTGRADLPADLCELAGGLIRREVSSRLGAVAVAEFFDLNNTTGIQGSTLGPKTSDDSSGSVDDEFLDFDPFADEDIVLIGREKQLAQLEAACQQVISEKKSQVVWITGLSGEGKSSLVEKFLQPLRKGEETLVLSGRCYDRESVPFKAVDCIIESLVRYLRSRDGRWLESDPPEDVEFLAQVFPLLRRVGWIDQRKIHHLARMKPQAIRGRAFYGLRQLLIAISQRISVAIHLDDLQWGDGDSARAWHELLNYDETPPLLVLGSYRSDEAAESPFLREWNQQTTSVFDRITDQTVTVEPLTMEECLEVAALRTGLPPQAIQPQIAQLFQETAGNPYFLDLSLEGFDPATGGFRHVPLDEIVSTRLSRLPEAASRLLEVIAISAQPIHITEAAAVAETSESVMATLTHMRSERLVRLMEGGVEPMAETWHDKVRESVLSQLPSEQLEYLHLRLAEEIENKQVQKASDWLESLRRISNPGEYAFPVSDRVLDLSRHFSAAGDQRAFVYLWLAGEQAMLAYAVEDAYDLFQQARSLLPTSEASTLMHRFWMGEGRIALLNKASEQAIEAYQHALDAASGQFEVAQTYSGLTAVNMQLGRFDEALRFRDLALAELDIYLLRSNPVRFFAFLVKSVRLLIWPSSWRTGKTQEQRRKAKLAQDVISGTYLAMAEKTVGVVDAHATCPVYAMRTGERARIAMSLSIFAQSWAGLGVSWLGRLYLRRARQGDTLLDPESAGVFYGQSGTVEYYLGRPQEAELLLEQAWPLLTRCCQFYELCLALHHHRHVLAYIGTTRAEFDKAWAVLELTTSTGNVQGICWGSYDVASALARAGQLSEAAHYMQQANRALPDEKFMMTWSIRASTDAYVRLQCSDYSGSRRLAEHAWSVIKEGCVAMDCTLLCVPVLVESLAGPDWGEALPIEERKSLKRALRRALIFYRMLPNQQAHIDRVRGRAYWRLGKQKKAIRHFEKAVRIADQKEMKYQKAKSLLDLAAVKEENRDQNRAEAIGLLKEMESVIPRAESWLLGDQYDGAVVAPEFDLEAWEREHGPIEGTVGGDPENANPG